MGRRKRSGKRDEGGREGVRKESLFGTGIKQMINSLCLGERREREGGGGGINQIIAFIHLFNMHDASSSITHNIGASLDHTVATNSYNMSQLKRKKYKLIEKIKKKRKNNR